MSSPGRNWSVIFTLSIVQTSETRRRAVPGRPCSHAVAHALRYSLPYRFSGPALKGLPHSRVLVPLASGPAVMIETLYYDRSVASTLASPRMAVLSTLNMLSVPRTYKTTTLAYFATMEPELWPSLHCPTAHRMAHSGRRTDRSRASQRPAQLLRLLMSQRRPGDWAAGRGCDLLAVFLCSMGVSPGRQTVPGSLGSVSVSSRLISAAYCHPSTGFLSRTTICRR